jgi:hypothetical protein
MNIRSADRTDGSGKRKSEVKRDALEGMTEKDFSLLLLTT